MFVAFVLESFGAFGREALKFIKRLVKSFIACLFSPGPKGYLSVLTERQRLNSTWGAGRRDSLRGYRSASSEPSSPSARCSIFVCCSIYVCLSTCTLYLPVCFDNSLHLQHIS